MDRAKTVFALKCLQMLHTHTHTHTLTEEDSMLWWLNTVDQQSMTTVY